LALAVALLVALAFAAWQVWLAVQGSPFRAPASPPASSAEVDYETDTRNPLAIGGVRPFHDDPCELEPPAGSERRGGLTTATNVQADYIAHGDVEALADHYAAQMVARGIRLLSRRSDASGRLVLTGLGEGVSCVVVLHRGGPEEKIVNVSITATLAAASVPALADPGR
jgi:hypothetical protein